MPHLANLSDGQEESFRLKNKINNGTIKSDRSIKICQITKEALLFFIKASPRDKANTPIKIAPIANLRLSFAGSVCRVIETFISWDNGSLKQPNVLSIDILKRSSVYFVQTRS